MAEEFVSANLVLPGTYIRVRSEGLIGVGGISTGNIGVVGTANQGIDETHSLSSAADATLRFGASDAVTTRARNLTRIVGELFKNGARTVYAHAVAEAAVQADYEAAFARSDQGRRADPRRARARHRDRARGVAARPRVFREQRARLLCSGRRRWRRRGRGGGSGDRERSRDPRRAGLLRARPGGPRKRRRLARKLRRGADRGAAVHVVAAFEPDEQGAPEHDSARAALFIQRTDRTRAEPDLRARGAARCARRARPHNRHRRFHASHDAADRRLREGRNPPGSRGRSSVGSTTSACARRSKARSTGSSRACSWTNSSRATTSRSPPRGATKSKAARS